MNARPLIDSLDFARNGQQISGKVPVAELSRLLDMLENPQGFFGYMVQGGMDKQGSPYLDIDIAGSCQLRCQRCLKGFDYPVHLNLRLLLRDQASLDALDDEEEEFDSILADAKLDVLDLLEEEILLSLPIAPKHELAACQPEDGENTHKEKQHPFAVLAKLKRSN